MSDDPASVAAEEALTRAMQRASVRLDDEDFLVIRAALAARSRPAGELDGALIAEAYYRVAVARPALGAVLPAWADLSDEQRAAAIRDGNEIAAEYARLVSADAIEPEGPA